MKQTSVSQWITAALGLLTSKRFQPLGWATLGWATLLCLGLSSNLFAGNVTIAAPISPTTLTTPTTVRVATRLIPPFVMQGSGELTGFSINLWEKIAIEMGLKSQLTVYDTLPEMLAAVDQGNADLAIAAISVTADRQQQFDFSYPMFSSGLQILVLNPQRTGFMPNLLRDLFSPVILQIIGLAILMVVIAAHIIWLFERRHPESMISKHYFPGIFEAAWWSASTLATQADQMPRGSIGRVIAVFWMFTAVIFVAYFTATVTTGMTVQQLQSNIQSVDDLSGRIVATTKGSTAAAFLQEQKIQTLEFAAIDEAYAALLTKKAEAVVFDAPVLLYYAAHGGRGKVQVVGEVFRDESYGIVLPNNSPYRKPMNAALLKLKENGVYDTLYAQWFKSKSGS